jgi:hypothetical protein
MADLSHHSKLLIDIASQEAKRRGHNPVSALHLLAGLMRQNRTRFAEHLGDAVVQDLASAMKKTKANVLDTLAIDESTTDLAARCYNEREQWVVLKEVAEGLLVTALASEPEPTDDEPGSDTSMATAEADSSSGASSSPSASTPRVDAPPPPLADVVAAVLSTFSPVLSAQGADAWQLPDAVLHRWFVAEPLHRPLLQDIWDVVVSIAGGDGEWSEKERETLTPVFSAHIASDVDVVALAQVYFAPEQFGQPSPVLQALVAHDAANNTHHARAYALRLVEIGRLTASCDSVVTRPEAEILDRLRVTVRSVLAPNNASALDPAVAHTSGELTEVDKVLAKLDALIGLDSVKKEIRTRLEWFRINDLRRKRGLPAEPQALHMAFLGNPGTGKTTIARLVGELFAAAGALRKGHLVEADRSKLVAQYMGQTSPLVHETVKKASGGVLFIDEAYSLAAAAGSRTGGDSYEREAVDTLVKLMEDKRDDLIVIFAGYSNPMKVFLGSNEGLASRVPTVIEFTDYDDAELMNVFTSMCELNGRLIAPAALASVKTWMLAERTASNFGNARAARNLLEEIMRKQALRLSQLGDLATDEELSTIEPADVPVHTGKKEDGKPSAGYV